MLWQANVNDCSNFKAFISDWPVDLPSQQESQGPQNKALVSLLRRGLVTGNKAVLHVLLLETSLIDTESQGNLEAPLPVQRPEDWTRQQLSPFLSLTIYSRSTGVALQLGTLTLPQADCTELLNASLPERTSSHTPLQ